MNCESTFDFHYHGSEMHSQPLLPSDSTKRVLLLLISVTNLIYPKSPNVFLLYLKALLKSWITSRNDRKNIKCIPLPDEIYTSLIPEKLKTSFRSQSFHHCVLLNQNSVCSFQESSRKTFFIPVSIHDNKVSNKQSNNVTQCIIEVIATQDFPPNKALMSETTFFNLKSALKRSMFENIILQINSVNDNTNIELKYASKVVVSLIQTPLDIHRDLVRDCLTNYFEKACLLRIGEVFAVNITQYVPETFYAAGLEGTDNLFFKVQELEGPPYDNIPNATKTLGYLISKTDSTLSQNKMQSFIPSRGVLFQNRHGNFQDKLLSCCPPSLDELTLSLIKSFKPFLEKSEIPKPPSIKPVFWLVGPPGSGKHILLSSLATHFGIHFWNFHCDEVFGKGSGQVEGRLRAVFSKARLCSPCLLMISDIELLCRSAEGHDDMRVISLFNELILEESEYPLLVVATSDTEASVSPFMARIFLQTFFVPNLDETDRKKQLGWFCRFFGANISEDCLDYVAGRCSGFLYRDIEALVEHAIRNNTQRCKSTSEVESHLTKEDFEEGLDEMQSAYSDAIGAPKIPSVTWADVGGLTTVKDEVLRTVNTPLHHPELVAVGLRRSGVLLYGPPGTGKTLIAKAVATECSLNFLSVKGPELLNMYVGQSEGNVRAVFQRARAASPCIIFFDELDSLAPNRGKSGDSGGVMDRVVSQLLAEMDGLQKSTHVFVIGATNRPDLIDPALLRPGRFDKLLYVSACEDHESIACVMRALTRKFKLAEDVDIENLSKNIPTQVTGADIYAVCSNAWRNAVRRTIQELLSGNGIKRSDVQVNQEDFKGAISAMIPSVSSEDMKYFKNLQQELSGNKNYALAN